VEGMQNRFEESRTHYQEALALLRKLAQGDSRYAGAVAEVQNYLDQLNRVSSAH
jgi:hypothetical protein